MKVSREDAIRSLINMWLKDPIKKCGWCGALYEPLNFPCCEKPFIATNFDIMVQFHKELKETRKERLNEFASTKGKHMRWKLSFPPSLLSFLDHSFRRLYNEKLFTEKYTSTWFAKKFKKEFSISEKI